MRGKWIAGLIAMGLLGCAHAERTVQAMDLKELCQDYWDYLMASSPGWATYLGDRRFEDRLEDISPEGRQREREALEAFKARLSRIDRGGLAESDRVTADTLDHELDRGLRERAFRFHEWDIDQMGGPQVWLFRLVDYHPMDERGRATFLARLEKFPRYVEDYIGNLREGMKSGNVAPRVAVDRVIEQLKRIGETPAKDSPLMGAAKKEGVKGFRESLLALIEEDIQPAYRRLLDFLEGEYQARAREAIAVGWNEFGKRAYEHRIWYHTSLRFTAEELHEMGRKILAGLQGDMLGIARRLGHEGDLRSFNAKLRSDKTQFYSSRAEVVRDAERCLSQAKETLPRLFGRLPKAECGVKVIEEYREKDSVAAFYEGPPEDGSRPGIYYINTYEPMSRPRYNMAALTIHEAVPGHHLQIAVARELKGLPTFRRNMGVTAFVEGWALYAELLGAEVGLYTDDLSRYGMLNYQAWRAARLVVDTGIHALGWTRDQAIAFYQENLAFSDTEIVNEIDRYIIWPGQALAYMVGRREIQSLRKQAEEALGDRFDVRAFHDTLLANGAVPLPVLRAVIERWIAKEMEE